MVPLVSTKNRNENIQVGPFNFLLNFKLYIVMQLKTHESNSSINTLNFINKQISHYINTSQVEVNNIDYCIILRTVHLG